MKKKIWLLILLLLIGTTNSLANDFDNVDVIRVYDGDTITVNINGVHPLLGEALGVRINGVDTPEIRGECERESYQAQVAKFMVKHMIDHNNKKVTLKNCERGKYFRLVCDVYTTEYNIAEELLKVKLGFPYDGGTKINHWCTE